MLREWYNKTVKFGRTRRVVEDILGKWTDKLLGPILRIELKPTQEKEVHGLLIKNTNTIDVNLMRR